MNFTRNIYFILLSLQLFACSKYEGEDYVGSCPGPDTSLSGADLKDKDLSACDFSYRNLAGIKFSDTNLDGANFSHAILDGSTFTRVHGEGVLFTGAKLDSVTFDEAHFINSDFSSSTLHDSHWLNTTLESVDLRRSRGHQVLFENSVLYRTQLSDTMLAFSEVLGTTIQDSIISHSSERTGFSNVKFSNSQIHQNDWTSSRLSSVIFTDSTLMMGNIFDQVNIDSSQFINVSVADIKFSNARISNSTITDSTFSTDADNNPGPPWHTNYEGDFNFDAPEINVEKINFVSSNLDRLAINNSHLAMVVFDSSTGQILVDNSNLESSKFLQSTFTESSFSNQSNLSKAEFKESNLNGSSFVGSFLNSSIFFGGQLQDVRFSGVEGNSASFSEVKMNGVNFHTSAFQAAQFNAIVDFDSQFYETTVTNSKWENIGDAVINFFSSDMSESFVKNSNISFHAISDSKIDGIQSENFAFTSVVPWEANPFKTMVEGASFSGSYIHGPLGDYFYEWIFQRKQPCTSRAVVTPSRMHTHPDTPAPFGYGTVVMTPEMIKNMAGMRLHGYCGVTYQCRLSGANLICEGT